ncbi:hypothetical protein [Lewinella sp. W8]|uniref:hypothetical protein n=1 Tax=Lewinella sp. W8 TaxID=2528208 RepID=UPI001068C6CA|nr:hypothetical protein [Lewinella sp. W8]MTB53903.1 hypothetical protein [Lewinella sp. W8]
MMEEILERVKKALDIRESTDLSDTQLYKLLEKTRNRYHPDKTTNIDAKVDYEEKFKELTELLEEFGKHITSKPINHVHELVRVENNFDLIESKQENLRLEQKNNNLNKEIDLCKARIKELNDEITLLRNNNAEKETKKLLELYKLNRVNVYAIGLIAILGLLFNLLLQVEKVANLFAKYAPFLNEGTVSYATLLLLAISSGLLLRKYLQEKIVDNWSKKINLSSFQKKIFEDEAFKIAMLDYSGYRRGRKKEDYESFSEYHRRTTDGNTYFLESVITKFLNQEFSPKNRIDKIYQNKFLNLDRIVIYDNLKNIIVYNLLRKDLIQAAGNHGFEKAFKINQI